MGVLADDVGLGVGVGLLSHQYWRGRQWCDGLHCSIGNGIVLGVELVMLLWYG